MTINWQTKTIDIESIKKNTGNPRLIKDKNFKKLVNSIKENGYNNRLIVDSELNLLAGHQRLEALKSLGYEQIEVLTPDRDLSELEVKRISIIDNISSGTWDADKLLNEWNPEQLIEWGISEDWLTGFDADEPKEKKEVKDKKQKSCPHCGELL